MKIQILFSAKMKLKKIQKDSDSKIVTTRSAPSMRLNLDKNFFQNKIFSSVASGKLVTNDVFKNYFRGCILKWINQVHLQHNWP